VLKQAVGFNAVSALGAAVSSVRPPPRPSKRTMEPPLGSAPSEPVRRPPAMIVDDDQPTTEHRTDEMAAVSDDDIDPRQPFGGQLSAPVTVPGKRRSRDEH
jgi:hypothetical protein